MLRSLNLLGLKGCRLCSPTEEILEQEVIVVVADHITKGMTEGLTARGREHFIPNQRENQMTEVKEDPEQKEGILISTEEGLDKYRKQFFDFIVK